MKQILKEQNLSSKALTAMNNLECEKMKAAYLEEQNKIMQEKQKLSVALGLLSGFFIIILLI